MALKTIMLRRSIDLKKALLEELREKDADFLTREAELEAAIAEAGTEDEQAAVGQRWTSMMRTKRPTRMQNPC